MTFQLDNLQFSLKFWWIFDGVFSIFFFPMKMGKNHGNIMRNPFISPSFHGFLVVFDRSSPHLPMRHLDERQLVVRVIGGMAPLRAQTREALLASTGHVTMAIEWGLFDGYKGTIVGWITWWFSCDEWFMLNVGDFLDGDSMDGLVSYSDNHWLVVEPPLLKIWVRQLGWWNSQYIYI